MYASVAVPERQKECEITFNRLVAHDVTMGTLSDLPGVENDPQELAGSAPRFEGAHRDVAERHQARSRRGRRKRGRRRLRGRKEPHRSVSWGPCWLWQRAIGCGDNIKHTMPEVSLKATANSSLQSQARTKTLHWLVSTWLGTKKSPHVTVFQSMICWLVIMMYGLRAVHVSATGFPPPSR